jgi:hypothetical protein
VLNVSGSSWTAEMEIPLAEIGRAGRRRASLGTHRILDLRAKTFKIGTSEDVWRRRAHERRGVKDMRKFLFARARGRPACYGTPNQPHTPVRMRAQRDDLDVTMMSVAGLNATSDLFQCPHCHRHPTVEDWADFLELSGEAGA